jgi:hypothetical protein
LDLKYLEQILAQAKLAHEMRLDILKQWGEDRVHLDD